jgi:RimJ/RimL family protein N-acetyltransferase
MAVSVRVLLADDSAALETFLRRHADSSMFLRSNLRMAGIVDRGETYHGTYVAAFEGGTMVGAIANSWSGMVLIQAPAHLDALVPALRQATDRPVSGFAGPADQVNAARRLFGMARRPSRIDDREILMALDVADLRQPASLVDGTLAVRQAVPADLDTLARWRAAYSIEALGAEDNDATRKDAEAGIRAWQERGANWVALRDGERVAFSGFNAGLPDMVQVGGVYTPPPLRRRGYGRAVVAGSLLAVAGLGVRRAILFVQQANVAAQRAYAALGFRPVGDYGLVLF